jgi:hypothetical protein
VCDSVFYIKRCDGLCCVTFSVVNDVYVCSVEVEAFDLAVNV